MARSLRIAYPGAQYHLTSRGNERRPIFWDDEDRHHFLRFLAKTIERFEWICSSYALMPNHFHLLVETVHANVSRGMQVLNAAYTQYFNWRHRRVGHLFQGRFKGILVEKESYFLTLCRYIPLNSTRASIVQDPGQDPWSSYRATAGLAPAPAFLRVQPVWDRFSDDPIAAQKAYSRFVHDGINAPSPWNELKYQIFLGSDEFIERLPVPMRPLRGIPQTQQRPWRAPMDEIISSDDDAQNGIAAGYKQQEIAEYLRISQPTLSRRLRE